MSRFANNFSLVRCLALPALVSLPVAAAHAAAPGINATGATATVNLSAAAANITQPDGAMLYAWGYGCQGAPAGFLPTAIAGARCQSMQLPGPTLIVSQGATVTVTL